MVPHRRGRGLLRGHGPVADRSMPKIGTRKRGDAGLGGWRRGEREMEEPSPVLTLAGKDSLVVLKG